MIERELLTEEISLGDYISFDDNPVTRSTETMNTVYLSLCDEVSVVSDDDDEKVNNEEDPDDPPNGRECLEMIEKIRYYFQCYKAKSLNRESTVYRDIQRVEEAIYTILTTNLQQKSIEDYFNVADF